MTATQGPRRGSSGQTLSTAESVNVLVVDDNESYRSALIAYLRTLGGVNIMGEADDGSSAVLLAGKLRPDLVLMDISMPGLDGLEAARRIRIQDPRTKIVFVTIHEEDAYKQVADLLHVDGFVSKSSVGHDLPKILRTIRAGLSGG
jgi:DNA-binding NarL/FixJ family response regulator